jgi:hypothetical protein
MIASARPSLAARGACRFVHRPEGTCAQFLVLLFRKRPPLRADGPDVARHYSAGKPPAALGARLRRRSAEPSASGEASRWDGNTGGGAPTHGPHPLACRPLALIPNAARLRRPGPHHHQEGAMRKPPIGASDDDHHHHAEMGSHSRPM